MLSVIDCIHVRIQESCVGLRLLGRFECVFERSCFSGQDMMKYLATSEAIQELGQKSRVNGVLFLIRVTSLQSQATAAEGKSCNALIRLLFALSEALESDGQLLVWFELLPK